MPKACWEFVGSSQVLEGLFWHDGALRSVLQGPRRSMSYMKSRCIPTALRGNSVALLFTAVTETPLGDGSEILKVQAAADFQRWPTFQGLPDEGLLPRKANLASASSGGHERRRRSISSSDQCPSNCTLIKLQFRVVCLPRYALAQGFILKITGGDIKGRVF